ncbi:MAG: hypothetical protein LIP77_03360, partial [Planctomycetes bacterium]|nr:hypothetical protein [Planctomycetota bacterium]
MMHSCWLRLVAFGLALFWPVAGLTADGDRAQPYEKVSYPSFSNGRLYSLLEADRAEVFDITDNSPRINMENVVIILYDQSAESLAATPEDQPLPVKTIITSDRGFLTRRPPQPGAEPEEIANLEGNVIMRRFRVGDPAPLRPSRLDPEVETEIRCEHARWNHTERILKGDGDVEFLQEDSRILGTGFLYLADDEALDTAGSSNIKDWGGIIFLERNPRMEIDSAAGRTVITCKETASYKLREREIQFERDVVVRSPGLVIESDILKVFLWKVEELPEHPDDNDHSPLPGQVRSIIATIGNRPGSVVISGSRVEDDGRETPQFAARGGRADFDYADPRLSLVDARAGRWPEVAFG